MYISQLLVSKLGNIVHDHILFNKLRSKLDYCITVFQLVRIKTSVSSFLFIISWKNNSRYSNYKSSYKEASVSALGITQGISCDHRVSYTIGNCELNAFGVLSYSADLSIYIHVEATGRANFL